MKTYTYKGVGYPICSVAEFQGDWIPLDYARKGHRPRAKTSYYLEFGTFDIETTSHIIRDPEGEIIPEESYGYMYHWQFCCGYRVVTGRTWSDFVDLLEKIHDRIRENQAVYLIYVHNLSFEFQFLHGILKFFGHDTDFFAVMSRKVLTLRAKDLQIEFRCSYRLTNRSLDDYIKDIPGAIFEKLSGSLNYRIERTPKTELTETELAYCYHDVLGLYDALKKDMAARGEDTATIPLTSTGFIRRALRAKEEAEAPWLTGLLSSAALDPPRYLMCKALARGGDTLASMSHELYTVHTEVDSWDIKSSHPARILMEKYPLGHLDYEGKNLPLEKLDRIREEGRYFITRILFFGLELKDWTTPIPALMEYKADYLSRGWTDPEDNSYIGPIVYNGRLCASSESCFCLDMITFEMVRSQYKWDKIIIGETYSSAYDYLPAVVTDFVRDLFRRKCHLEIQKKTVSKEDPSYPDIIRRYALSKAELNGVFGMFYTDPVRGIYNISEEGEWSEEHPAPLEMTDAQKRDLYKNQVRSVGQYLWGIHTAALSRLALDDLIQAVGYDKTLYADTDSDKALSSPDVDKRISELNNRIREKAAARGGIVEVEGHTFCIGVVEKETEKEPYSEFISGGAKKYACREGGEIHITISGVAKKYQDDEGTWHNTAEQLHDDIRQFAPDKVFDPAGGQVLHYKDEAAHYQKVKGDDGTEAIILTAGSIFMTGRVVTLGKIFDTRGDLDKIDDLQQLALLETVIDKMV